jgi:uncharacterized membrane protein HdeD (DUF308 family)
MITMLARNWWVLVLRGVLAVLFGIVAFFMPGPTAYALVLLFGAYALVDGIFAVITGIREYDERERWWAVLLEGIAGIIVGVLTFLWPGVAGLVLLTFIAAWAIITGVFEIMAAIRLRREIEGEWLLGLSGVASVLFGLLLLFQPVAGLIAVTWIIGAYAILFGVLLIALGLQLRGLRDTLGRQAPGIV